MVDGLGHRPATAERAAATHLGFGLGCPLLGVRPALEGLGDARFAGQADLYQVGGLAVSSHPLPDRRMPPPLPITGTKLVQTAYTKAFGGTRPARISQHKSKTFKMFKAGAGGGTRT